MAHNPLTTHILDTSRGKPAAGVRVTLDSQTADGTWTRLGEGTTGSDGRLADLPAGGAQLAPGTYRLTFAIGPYFEALGTASFYDDVPIVFHVTEAEDHVHVPLLVSPFSYSTYRGS